MATELPIVCSLDASGLEERLAAIAEVGADALRGRSLEGGGHHLRFRSDPRTRRRLEEVIAAEAECCAFLDLSLREAGEELILSIAAPEAGQSTADALAGAFAVHAQPNSGAGP
jgi:hypothetical protein